jgi:hypothetical protein
LRYLRLCVKSCCICHATIQMVWKKGSLPIANSQGVHSGVAECGGRVSVLPGLRPNAIWGALMVSGGFPTMDRSNVVPLKSRARRWHEGIEDCRLIARAMFELSLASVGSFEQFFRVTVGSFGECFWVTVGSFVTFSGPQWVRSSRFPRRRWVRLARSAGREIQP